MSQATHTEAGGQTCPPAFFNKRDNMRHTLLALLALLTLAATPARAKRQTEGNAREAKELFTRVYEKVFGPEGSSLSYAVNIIGLYKTEGDIVYKAKKLRYQESRYAAWEDGVTAYMVDKKKRTVNIHRADDDSKDEYLSKFKYDVNNFKFSYTTEGDYYILKADLKDANFFGIREVQGRILRSDLRPVSVTIKLAFLRTTVKISNFRSGGVDDKCFVFPRAQFKDYTFIDHRSKK